MKRSPAPDLRRRCTAYLEAGPPARMTGYVPGSIAEVIIAHGANATPLDDELSELGRLALEQEAEVRATPDPEIRDYLLAGLHLVREVLDPGHVGG